MNEISPHTQLKKQSGAILIIALVLLLVLTIMGVSGITTTQMQERMAGNQQEHTYAFESAEAALRVAEDYLENNLTVVVGFDSDGSDGLYDDSVSNLWESVDWDNADSDNDNEAVQVSLSGITGAYVIEHFGTFSSDSEVTSITSDQYGDSAGVDVGAANLELFRITARGAGKNNRGYVFLQVTYAKEL